MALDARGWNGPAEGWDGGLLRTSMRFAVLDLPSWGVLPSEVTVEGGYRWSLGKQGGEHHLFAVAGTSVFVSVARQHKVAYLHLPRVSVGYHWYSGDWLVEVGPSVSLALLGKASLALGDERAPWGGAPSYSARPVTGVQVSVVNRTNLLLVTANRTWLAGPGHGTDHLVGFLCHSAIPTREFRPGLGGCLVGDAFHDRFPSAPAAWSYQAHLDLLLTFSSGL